MNDPLGSLNTIAEARRRLGGIGRTAIYALIRTGQLQAIKLGSRTFISDAEIEHVLNEATAKAAEKAAARRDRRAA